MKRLILFVAIGILVAATSVERVKRQHDHLPSGHLGSRSSIPGYDPSAETVSLVLAPSDGGGMGTVCACSAVTGAAGETITWTRNTTAYCDKGQGFVWAPGDLVQCAANQPRVMYGRDGGSTLGLYIESITSNIAKKTESFENDGGPGSWEPKSVEVAAPTVTTDNALSPANTLTAETVYFPATSGDGGAGEASFLYLDAGCGSGSTSRMYSVFVRASDAGSGSTQLVFEKTPGTLHNSVQCDFSGPSYSRCQLRNPGLSAVAHSLLIGNFSSSTYVLDGGSVVAHAEQTLDIWGAQCETYAPPEMDYPSSYIPNLDIAGSATRNDDIAVITLNNTSTPSELSVSWSQANWDVWTNATISGDEQPFISVMDATSDNTPAFGPYMTSLVQFKIYSGSNILTANNTISNYDGNDHIYSWCNQGGSGAGWDTAFVDGGSPCGSLAGIHYVAIGSRGTTTNVTRAMTIKDICISSNHNTCR